MTCQDDVSEKELRVREGEECPTNDGARVALMLEVQGMAVAAGTGWMVTVGGCFSIRSPH